MYKMFKELSSKFCSDWPQKLIACPADGAANMTRPISGVVSNIQDFATERSFIKVASDLQCFAGVMRSTRPNDIIDNKQEK
ncbi:hypothetical protein Plhal304r1_c026g0088041 [Plasmopara halstedii]